MQRTFRNAGGYGGETVDIAAVVESCAALAADAGMQVQRLPVPTGGSLLALTRMTGPSPEPKRIYISAGIHGDEPAGPLAVLQLLREQRWPQNLNLWICPCLNPAGFALNRRENAGGKDLNRDYRDPATAEIRAHVGWLRAQPDFDATFCLHEDWEASGFYLYELNPEQRPSLAGKTLAAVAGVCPLDLAPEIEGRPAQGGLISPNLDPASRPEWPEAFWLLQNKTRLSYTLEAPSDFPLATRIRALVTGMNAALNSFV